MNIDKLEIKLLKQSENHIEVEIFFALQSGLYQGHFPELPLLPGVIQTHLAFRLFEKYSNTKLQFTGAKNIKFFTPIFPDSIVHAECFFEIEKNLLNFKYFKGEKVFAKGCLTVKHV